MDICQNHHSGVLRLVAFLILSLLFSPDGGLPRPGFRRCTTTPNAQPRDCIPWASFLTSAFCFVLVLDLFSPGNPHSYLSQLCFLLSDLGVNCQSLLSVVLLLGVVMGLGDAVDQEGGEGKRKEVLLLSDPTQSVSSMNHNLPGAHLLLC